MRVRITTITTLRSGNQARREEVRDLETLRIGRATDNDIVVPGLTVALYHAEIHARGDKTWIDSRTDAPVKVNRRLVETRTLGAGDTVEIGHTAITVVEPDATETLAIEIEERPERETPSDAADVLAAAGIERGLLARRPLSWLAVAAVLALMLAAPLWSLRSLEGSAQGARSSEPAEVAGSPGLQALLVDSWSSGPLSSAHGNLGADCRTCHTDPFTPVSAAECSTCHAGSETHAASARGAVNAAPYCLNCHVEHQGESDLAALADETCGGCHENLEAHAAGTGFENVADFASSHPEFAVTAGDTRIRLAATETVRADSGLIFSHAQHLEAGLRSARAASGTETLECESCHQASDDGGRRYAAAFEEACQGCHALDFDPDDPTRALPHGPVDELARYLGGHFARAAVEGRVLDSDAPQAARRRPGRPMTPAELEEIDGWVRKRTGYVLSAAAAPNGVCGTCHRMTAAEREGTELPTVAPVKTSGLFFPHAAFDHGAHRNTPCVTCHAAEAANDADMVLMPSVTVCRTCHGGGEPVIGRVTSPCTQCHSFHDAEGHIVRTAQGQHGKDGKEANDAGAATYASVGASAR